MELQSPENAIMSDEEIVELYWQRDERAIRETDVKYKKFLLSVAYNVLHDTCDCEECLNDTYLGAWNAIPPARPQNFPAYLSGMARNISVSRARANSADKRGGGEVALSLHELEECLPAPSEVGSERLASLLNGFLAELPKQERMVFVCRYWRCDSIAALAKQFGFGESKVKMMLMRTREKLRVFLEKEGYPL